MILDGDFTPEEFDKARRMEELSSGAGLGSSSAVGSGPAGETPALPAPVTRPVNYRDVARELAEKVDELCEQRIERNRRIAELEARVRELEAGNP